MDPSARETGSRLLLIDDDEKLCRLFGPRAARRPRRHGLAIVKSCMDACGGKVVCRNRQPSGLETTLTACCEVAC